MVKAIMDLHGSVQNFLVNSYGVGIVRNMGPMGYLDCCKFLKIDLTDLSKKNPSQYPQFLNHQTKKLLRYMPTNARHWGAARKCLNLFFRDALYSFYLREKYGLGKFEKYQEIALDSNVGRRFREEKEGEGLPLWRTVISLTPEVSAQFQKVATKVAKRERTARVHLDVHYWRGGQ